MNFNTEELSVCMPGIYHLLLQIHSPPFSTLISAHADLYGSHQQGFTTLCCQLGLTNEKPYQETRGWWKKVEWSWPQVGCDPSHCFLPWSPGKGSLSCSVQGLQIPSSGMTCSHVWLVVQISFLFNHFYGPNQGNNIATQWFNIRTFPNIDLSEINSPVPTDQWKL